MMSYQLVALLSLMVFTFGAISFSVLTLVYWKERGLRQGRRRAVFPWFTTVCASAFVVSLLLQFAASRDASPAWMGALTVALDLATAMVAALLAHLVYVQSLTRLRVPGVWRRAVATAYGAAILVALAKSLDDAGVLPEPWDDYTDAAPALLLASASALGLAIHCSSRRPEKPAERRYGVWMGALLALLTISAAANLLQPDALLAVLPDYLLLAFFGVTLYYKERLTFFDLLIKKGAYFALATTGLTVFFLWGGHAVQEQPWVGALLLAPFWLAGPWLYGKVSGAIDWVWLRRRYSSAEAERLFADAIQSASVESELCSVAEASLREIFGADVEIRRNVEHVPPVSEGLGACVLERRGGHLGDLLLSPRTNQIPFLSDDRRLLQSLARTLGVVFENVRFLHERRRQEEQAQELRWLASRAELKALRAQINPHFLFNALNAIAGLIQERPQLADETIEQLAHVFRYTLRKSETEWVRLDEEVEFAAAYLRVEQARFGERLRVEFDVEPMAGALSIPAMSVQPLIENAIKHGVSPIEGAGFVAVRAEVKDESLVVEVSDSGPGFPPGFSLAPSTGEAGHGLWNIMSRLQGYYGDAARLRWDRGANRTTVTLTMPVRPGRTFEGSKASVAGIDRRR